MKSTTKLDGGPFPKTREANLNRPYDQLESWEQEAVQRVCTHGRGGSYGAHYSYDFHTWDGMVHMQCLHKRDRIEITKLTLWTNSDPKPSVLIVDDLHHHQIHYNSEPKKKLPYYHGKRRF